MPMTFPDDIPAISVTGTPITEECFPRRRQRRFMPDAGCDYAPEFCKRHEEHLDYSVDMSRVLNPGEVIICATAWSNDPDALPVTLVHYAQKGALAYVHAGAENACYLVTMHVRTNQHRVFTYRFLIRITCHEFDAHPNYEPPAVVDDTACGCECNFFVDLLGEYVGPFYWDAEAEPLFACFPPDEG